MGELVGGVGWIIQKSPCPSNFPYPIEYGFWGYGVLTIVWNDVTANSARGSSLATGVGAGISARSAVTCETPATRKASEVASHMKALADWSLFRNGEMMIEYVETENYV
jgi:hypothetical protein